MHLSSIEYVPAWKGLLILTSAEDASNALPGNALWFLPVAPEDLKADKFKDVTPKKVLEFEAGRKAEGICVISEGQVPNAQTRNAKIAVVYDNESSGITTNHPSSFQLLNLVYQPESKETKPQAEGPTIKVTLPDGSEVRKLDLVEGEKRIVTVKAYDSKGAEIQNVKTAILEGKPGVVKIVPSGNTYTITASGVKKQDSTILKVKVDDQERPEAQFDINVLEAVTKVDLEGGNALSLTENESVTLKLRVKGSQSESLDVVTQPFETPERSDSLIGLITIERDPIQGGFIVNAGPLPSATPVTGHITLKAINGTGKQPVITKITVTIRERFGRITFEPPPRGFLLPGGSFATLAVVRGKNDAPKTDYGVEFKLVQESDAKWVSLSPEGNKLTVFWNEPTDAEITRPDGSKEQRPAQVRIRAIARNGVAGQDIYALIVVRMGEVGKFSWLKVKLNVMDERTAGDLYGKVMNDEYYVLIVRLFNNLRDDITKQFTGDSILAYSSSIEVAVGLEKKFNADSESDFPNVIGRSAARDLAKQRSQAAVALADVQVKSEIAAAKQAQGDLQTAIDNERIALQESLQARKVARDRIAELTALLSAWRLREATAERTKDPNDRKEAVKARASLDAAVLVAEHVRAEANAKIIKAQEALDATNRVRASIMRQAAGRAKVSQNVIGDSDPDTAIDDGRWHPVNPADFNRITKVEEPSEDAFALLPPLPPEFVGGNIQPQTTNEQPQSEEEKPLEEIFPCRGTISYRPFTFEMMVNTVDRRDGRSTRSKVFKILDSIGTGTSFITSIAVPSSGSDLPLGLEKYGNLLIPGIDKLYPNYKEQNRQNIVAQAMKEIEEIPFGSDITRVIFIPKKKIRGLVRGHDTRISEVCPFYFKIEVAIISKRGTVTGGQP
jgi:hypothetical protein